MKTVRHRLYTIVLVGALSLPNARSFGEPDRRVYSKLPIQEVTVFKDGHAFLLHEGTVSTDPKGCVRLDSLPNPVLGTFWAHSAESAARLSSVLSSRDSVDANVPAEGLLDLVQANGGMRVIVQERDQTDPYEATVVQVLARDPTSPEAGARAAHPSNTDPTVLLRLASGTKALPFSQIRTVTFVDGPRRQVSRSQQKDTLELRLDWGGDKPGDSARVGLTYIQRGIRWIPGYRLDIDGEGLARVQLQATLINELADLNDVTAHLVIGVPRFVFQDTPDPISFQQAVAQLSSAMRPDSRTAYSLSNAIMSQRAYPSPGYDAGGNRQDPALSMDLGPELKGSDAHEDLFVFDLEHVTLRKGQRVVVPLGQFDLPYTDAYTLSLPVAPPLEMRGQFDTNQQVELARLFHRPKVMHKLRLKNTASCPLTTAPVLILKKGRVLAQAMTTYTPMGGTCDVEVTAAVNITVHVSDQQTEVTPDAVNWNGRRYTKVQMAGSVTLASYSAKPVHVEVTRSVLGVVDQAGQDGRIAQSQTGDSDWLVEEGLPVWWTWRSWPSWWYHFNSLGRIQWEFELKPSETASLDYTWHYFWLP